MILILFFMILSINCIEINNEENCNFMNHGGAYTRGYIDCGCCDTFIRKSLAISCPIEKQAFCECDILYRPSCKCL